MLARAAGMVLVGLLPVLASCTQNPPAGDTGLPVIFVHGYLGSGSQYRSQALRWASNGFPIEKIRAFNYDTQNINSSGLDALVDSVRAQFGVSKVNIVGHSLGTSVTNSYVSRNAAKVNRFVLVDGVGCPLGNRSCQVIRASELGQTHVEASVSAESFDRQYRFFMDKAPTTTAVVPEAPGQVRIGGNVLKLQTNIPAAGFTGQVWELNSATGQRVGGTPAATFTVRADGSWGPVTVDNRKHYEIAAGNSTMTAHYYFEPFVRSDNLVHLITSDPTSATSTNTNRGPNHVTLVVQRQRELWRSHGARNDVLRVTTAGQTANVFQNVTGDVVAAHIHDNKATPGVTTLALLDFFRSQAFQTGVDVYMPASPSANGTVEITNVFRGDASKVQRLAVPNWPSSTHHVIVELNDYVN